MSQINSLIFDIQEKSVALETQRDNIKRLMHFGDTAILPEATIIDPCFNL